MATFDIKRKQDLINIKKRLQKRAITEKVGDLELQSDVVKMYEPIIKPLKAIEQQQQAAIVASQKIPVVPAIEASIPAIEEPPRTIPAIEPSQAISLGPIAVRYLSKVWKKDYDWAYGIKRLEDNFSLGQKNVNIVNNDIFIDGEKYTGTEGLWELLTLSKPETYTDNDLETYKTIMFTTRPFLRSDGNPKPNRVYKWSNIMKDIYKDYEKRETQRVAQNLRRESRRRSSYTGAGLIILPSNTNDLLSRHRLLFRELQAGNNGVYNEIQAINDQLFKRNILSSEFINKFNKIFLIK